MIKTLRIVTLNVPTPISSEEVKLVEMKSELSK